jgi:hypothetical protein
MISLASDSRGARDASHTLRASRALGVWLVIIAAETIHGVLRQILLVPLVGDLRARQIGVLIGSLLIFAVACWLGRSIGARTAKGQLTVGAGWVVLTVAFELGLGALLGLTRERMLADYDPRAGGFMLFGLVFMWLSLWLAARVRQRSAPRP